MLHNWQGCSINDISIYGSISVSTYGYLSAPQIAGLHKSKRNTVYTSKTISFNELSGSFPVANHSAHGANRCEFKEKQHLSVLHFSEGCVLQVDELAGDGRELDTSRYKAQSDSSLFGAFSSADYNCGFAQC